MAYKYICKITTMKGFVRVLKDDSQATLQDILNKRIYITGKGWSRLKMSQDVWDELIQQAVDVLGGRKKDVLRRKLNVSPPPQHWGLSRMVFEKSRKKIVYIAGQDYVWELNNIREWLYAN